MSREQLVAAIAMSLYAYNVSPGERARAIHKHFDGNCMEFEDMLHLFRQSSAYVATELPFPSAKVYLEQALERYGAEAEARINANT